MTRNVDTKEKAMATAKLRTAIQFWMSFARSARFNHHTKETIEITIESLKYVLGKLEAGEIDMIRILKSEAK